MGLSTSLRRRLLTPARHQHAAISCISHAVQDSAWTSPRVWEELLSDPSLQAPSKAIQVRHSGMGIPLLLLVHNCGLGLLLPLLGEMVFMLLCFRALRRVVEVSQERLRPAQMVGSSLKRTVCSMPRFGSLPLLETAS